MFADLARKLFGSALALRAGPILTYRSFRRRKLRARQTDSFDEAASTPSSLTIAKQCLICILVLVAGFLGLQALAISAIDEKVLLERLREALTSKVLTEETDPTSPFGHTGLKFDMFSECIALGTNLLNSDRPLLERLAEIPHIRLPRKHPCPSLALAVRTGSPIAARAYYRYWHGHQVYLKPLLRVMSLANVHKTTAILLIASVVFLTGVLAIEFGWFAWIAFPIPFLVSTDLLTVSAVTVHALSLIWTFFSVGAIALFLRKRKANDRFLFVAVFATGAVGSYFDVLWNPPLAPTLISFLAILSVVSASGVLKAAVWRGLVLAGAWFAGFALAYLSKWVFAAAVIGPKTVSIDIVDQILLRISGEVDSRSVPLLAATIAQLQDIGLMTLAISWGVAAAIAAVAMWRCSAAGRGPHLSRLAMLCGPLAIPVLWVEVLRNHSIIHVGFVSRTFALFAVIPLLSSVVFLRAVGQARTNALVGTDFYVFRSHLGRRWPWRASQ